MGGGLLFNTHRLNSIQVFHLQGMGTVLLALISWSCKWAIKTIIYINIISPRNLCSTNSSISTMGTISMILEGYWLRVQLQAALFSAYSP